MKQVRTERPDVGGRVQETDVAGPGRFLAAGEAALASRPGDGAELESQRLKAKLGEVMIERELLDEKIAALEAGRPLARRRPRP